MSKHLKKLSSKELNAIKKEREAILNSIDKERKNIEKRLMILQAERIRAAQKLRTVQHWINANNIQKILNKP